MTHRPDRFAITVAAFALLIPLLTVGCSDDPSGVENASQDADAGEQGGTFDVDEGAADSGIDSSEDELEPYETGEYTVATDEITDGPVDVVVFYPEEADDGPLVVFQHGFLMANTHYSELLTHVASHGHVVVAPQMYEPGGFPTSAPSTEEEAELANELYDWVDEELVNFVDVDTDRLGLAGHSRGAKVIWWALGDVPRTVEAVAGVDPVDGTGGPLDDDPQVLEDPVDIDAPLVALGTGLGSESAGVGQPACAPEDENYEEFFAASSPPAWQIVAPDYGHLDMLDDDPDGCGLECEVCVDGDTRAPMRQLTGGVLVALFGGAFDGVDAWFDVLEDDQRAPVDIETEAK